MRRYEVVKYILHVTPETKQRVGLFWLPLRRIPIPHSPGGACGRKRMTDRRIRFSLTYFVVAPSKSSPNQASCGVSMRLLSSKRFAHALRLFCYKRLPGAEAHGTNQALSISFIPALLYPMTFEDLIVKERHTETTKRCARNLTQFLIWRHVNSPTVTTGDASFPCAQNGDDLPPKTTEWRRCTATHSPSYHNE